jgi:hypothetical protein
MRVRFLTLPTVASLTDACILMGFLESTHGQKLSYEKRFEIASRLCEVLRSLYQDRVVMLSDTRALRLAEDDRDIQHLPERKIN